MTQEERKERIQEHIDRMPIEQRVVPAVFMGAKSAWNMFNLKKLELDEHINKNAQATIEQYGNGDPQAMETSEEHKREIQKSVEKYKQNELEVRRQYDAFKNTLDDSPSIFLSDLAYSGAKQFLNPIEMAKTHAINGLVGKFFGGMKVASTVGKALVIGAEWAVNTAIDTYDNLRVDQWEMDKLEIEDDRTEEEKVLQAFGGAVVGNTLIPMLKIGGRTVKGIGGAFADGFNAKSVGNVQDAMNGVDAVDLTTNNPINSLKNIEFFKNLDKNPLPEGTFGVNLNREISSYNMKLETGYTESVVDYNEFVYKVGNTIDAMQAEMKATGNFDVNKVSVSIDESAKEFANDFFAKPIEITQAKFKAERKQNIQWLTSRYDDDILSSGYWRKNVNERLGGDLEDGTISDALVNSIYGVEPNYLIKDGVDIDQGKMKTFANLEVIEFREAIGTGVTYITKENDSLFRTHPKYKSYFSETRSVDDFNLGLEKACQDYINGAITRDEFKMVVFYQSEGFKAFQGMGEIGKGKYVTKVNSTFNEILEKSDLTEEQLQKFRKFARIENLEKKLETIKTHKVDTAIMSLAFNKKEAFDFFANVKDYDARMEFLGHRANSIIIEPGETHEQALNRVVDELFKTHKNIKGIASDVEGAYADYSENISKDLIDVIKDNFEGNDVIEKMDNYSFFMGNWKNDNIQMLNTMEEITTGTKASVTSLGLPMYQLENLATNKNASLLQLAFDIPVLRKNYQNFVELSKKHPMAYTRLEKSIIDSLKNYCENKNPFNVAKQKDVLDTFGDALTYTARNYFLAFSGTKETLSHPILTATKTSKYYKGNFIKSLAMVGKDLPRTYGIALLHELKPVMGANVKTKKLHRALGNLIGGEELATLELARSYETISPIKTGTNLSIALKDTARIAQDVNLHIQGSMQNIRYVASRFQGINVIKSALKTKEFDMLAPETKEVFKTYHVGDDISFTKWKQDVKTHGLKNSLYANGKSDITKYIHEHIAQDAYAEDPLKNVKAHNLDQHFFNRFRTMFTTYTNDFLNYGTSVLKNFKDENGVVNKRFSKEYLNYVKRNPLKVTAGLGNGALAIYSLGNAKLVGEYIQGVIFQTSKDEEIEAKLQAIKDSGHNKNKYLGEFALETLASGAELDSALKGSNTLGSLQKRLAKGEILPNKLSSLYNAIKGTPIYNEHPYGLDWYEMTKYNEKVTEDRNKRLGSDDNTKNKKELEEEAELFHKMMLIATAEAMEEEGEITQEQCLDLKRNNGIDDREDAKSIEGSKNYDLILKISLAQGGDEKDTDEFQRDLMRNISFAVDNDLLDADEKELLEKLDVTEDEALMLKSEYQLTDYKKKALDDYMDSLDEPDHIQRMILKAKKTKELLSN